MSKLAASEAARGGGGIEFPPSGFGTNVLPILALPHQHSMVRLEYNIGHLITHVLAKMFSFIIHMMYVQMITNLKGQVVQIIIL